MAMNFLAPNRSRTALSSGLGAVKAEQQVGDLLLRARTEGGV